MYAIRSYYAILVLSNTTLVANEQTNVSIEPINIEDSLYESREDLNIDSTKNLYRIEKTAQFGTEVITQKDIEA